MIFIQEDQFENVAAKMAVTLSQSGHVNVKNTFRYPGFATCDSIVKYCWHNLTPRLFIYLFI